MNAVIQIEQKVKKLSLKVYKLTNISTFILMAGFLVGIPISFFYGPTALGISAAIAVPLAFGVEVFASMIKRECTKEVLDLESKHLLSATEAEKLKNDITAINGRPPK